jgi:iron complex outermembrane receptor protein
LYTYKYRTRDTSYATYAQGTYDLSQWTGVKGLSVTAGVRQTWEKVIETDLAGGLFPADSQNLQEARPSWQFGLADQLTSATLLYFVTRGSWRAGGFSDGSPANNANRFGPETTHDFEFGMKFSGAILDAPAALNIALYDQISYHVQHDVYVIPPGGFPTSYTVNVPEGEVKGFELDGQVRPLPWLTVGGVLTYTSASFPENTPAVGGAVGVPLTNYPDTPRWSGSVFATVRLPTPQQWGVMSYHVDAYTQASEYFSAYNFNIEPGSQIPGYTLVNMRLDLKEIADSHISVGLYTKNVLNRFYFAGGMAVSAALGDNLVVPGQPRTYGLELNYHF